MDDGGNEPKGMPLRARVALVVLGFAVFSVLVVAWVAGFLRTSPPTVTARTVSTPAGKQAYITMQTVGAIGYGPRPTWVSYLMKNSAGVWKHTTIFQVPAHATIHVTVEQYDSAGLLRNARWAEVGGTIGDVEHLTGKLSTGPKLTDAPISQIGVGDAAHTFAIPSLGVYVPMIGVTTTAPLCATAPCTLKSPHNIISFSFKTGSAEVYRWQCFVPCGLNYVDGNGGPMQSVGYMMGFMKVVG